MRLDVRFPIGGMFSIIGAILMIYGIASNPAIYEKSLGINVNLWWGLVLLVFGLVMLAYAVRQARRNRQLRGQAPSPPVVS